jgi:hypothetical protein
MSEQEIKEGNSLIAKYMGYRLVTPEMRRNPKDWVNSYWEMKPKNHGTQVLGESNNLCYHSSWSWLMPVVDKIMSTKIGGGINTVDYPYLRTFGMRNEKTGYSMVRFNGFFVHEAPTLKEATFMAVVEFINLLNQDDGKA